VIRVVFDWVRCHRRRRWKLRHFFRVVWVRVGWLGVGLSAADQIALEGVEFGLERLHVGAHEVEVEILGGLEICRGGGEMDFERERELNAALEHVEELRVATRELRERAAKLSGGI
jgi:hypothetical protein